MCLQLQQNVAHKNDWRTTQPTMVNRFKHMCLREEYSDVDFIFKKGLPEEMIIRAHSFLLTFASEAFEKLFVWGGVLKRQEIVIDDDKLKADGVRALLKFIYSDFKDVADINNESVWDVLYAAKAYMVPALEKHCTDFLVQNLSAKNVFDVLERGLEWELGAELLEKCKEVIRTRTNEVLNSEQFPSISLECLTILLEQETLSVTEGQLLKSMLEWATKACQNARISPIPVNLRQQLGTEAFSLIRFPTMSKQDFVQIALPSKILSLQEERDLMLMMAFDGAQITNPLPFSETPRGLLTEFNAINVNTQQQSYQVPIVGFNPPRPPLFAPAVPASFLARPSLFAPVVATPQSGLFAHPVLETSRPFWQQGIQAPSVDELKQSNTSSLFEKPQAGPFSTFGAIKSTTEQANLLNGCFQNKFEPLISADTMVKNGISSTIQTKHLCISAMKTHEEKSPEELRMENYGQNCKTVSTTTGTGITKPRTLGFWS